MELLAALKGLECFTPSTRDTIVELRINNIFAVNYINKLGGCRSAALCAKTLRISDWCEVRSIELHAVFLPGTSNFLADAESRDGQLGNRVLVVQAL